MSSETIIQTSSVSKWYETSSKPLKILWNQVRLAIRSKQPNEPPSNNRCALQDVSININRGEIVGIIGENGAGKSTFLQILAGVMRPSSGCVNVNGKLAALLELGSGFNAEFSGRDNVLLNAALYGLNITEASVEYKRILDFAAIGEYIDRPVKTYSSGMLMRLAFSVLTEIKADILIIDEALSVGDIFFSQKCNRFLKTFMEKGTVLFVSHDIGAVRALCSRVIWIDNGRLRADGDPKTVTALYLQKLYASTDTSESPILTTKSYTLQSLPPESNRTLRREINTLNEIVILKNTLKGTESGQGGMAIVSVALHDSSGRSIAVVSGGELVVLKILIHSKMDADTPIVGFYLRDSLGQTLIGDNTYLEYLNECTTVSSGEYIYASFCFSMPILPKGDYSITAAIATGTQASFIHQHWMHDAIVLKSVSSYIHTGLVGVKMTNILMKNLGVKPDDASGIVESVSV